MSNELIYLSNSQISKINAQASPDDFIDNPKTIVILKKKTLLKKILIEDFKVEIDK